MTVFVPLVSEATRTFPLAALVFAVGLALVHVASGAGLTLKQGRQWLSTAGGASVAYVFVLLLPEINEVSLRHGEVRGDELLFEQIIYIFVLLGFVFFYGVEVFVAQQRDGDIESASLFYWAHIVVFALYSALIGYLLFHQQVRGVLNLLFYTLAMAFHFAITDFGIRRHHGVEYDRVGRWVLAGATLLGAGVGLLVGLEELFLTVLFAFLSGSIVFNVIKEELPDARSGLFVPFVAGAIGYTLLLVLV